MLLPTLIALRTGGASGEVQSITEDSASVDLERRSRSHTLRGREETVMRPSSSGGGGPSLLKTSAVAVSGAACAQGCPQSWLTANPTVTVQQWG